MPSEGLVGILSAVPRVTKEVKADQDAAVRAVLTRHAKGWVHGAWPTPGIRLPPPSLPPMEVTIPVQVTANGRKKPHPYKGIEYGPGKHGPSKPKKKVRTIALRPIGQR